MPLCHECRLTMKKWIEIPVRVYLCGCDKHPKEESIKVCIPCSQLPAYKNKSFINESYNYRARN